MDEIGDGYIISDKRNHNRTSNIKLVPHCECRNSYRRCTIKKVFLPRPSKRQKNREMGRNVVKSGKRSGAVQKDYH